ncbi:hypothetical protein Tco_0121381 [Tanacetum coccineum]
MDFVSSLNNNTSNSNEAVNAAHGVSTASTQVNTAYSTNIDNLSDAVISLVSCDGLGGYDWSDQAEEGRGPNYALMAYSSSKGLRYEKYNAVPPPYTRNFMPPTPDLSFTGLDEFVNKPVVKNRKSDKEVPKVVKKNDDAPINKDWGV